MSGELTAAALGVLSTLAVTVVSASLAIRLERQKQRALLEAQAVIDVGSAIAMVAVGSNVADRDKAMVLFAHAKLRLAAYGSGEAAHALGMFIERGAST